MIRTAATLALAWCAFALWLAVDESRALPNDSRPTCHARRPCHGGECERMPWR